MIKVELFYKVSMYDSDWMMTEAEYDEFRNSANNLPVFFTGPQIKDEKGYKEVDLLSNQYQALANQVDGLATYIMENVEGEPSQSEGAIDTAIRLLKERTKEIFLPKFELEPVVSKSMGAGLIEKEHEGGNKTGFYEIVGIEEEAASKTIGTGFLISAPEVVCVNGACTLVLEEEEPEVKERKKPGRKPARNFSKYIQLYEDGVDQKEIRDLMQDEMKIGNLTAEQYFYTYVKKVAKAKAIASKSEIIEKEKKQLLKELEPKINRKKVDPVLFNAIDSLPHYSTPQQFKDACASADIGRGRYSITELKEIYLDTHSAVKW